MSSSTPTSPAAEAGRPAAPTESVALVQDWTEIFSGHARQVLTAGLQQWLPSRRWFRGKARTIMSVSLREQIPVPMGKQKAFLVLFEVRYAEGEPELYVLPLTAEFGKKADALTAEWPQLVLTRVTLNRLREHGVIYDAIVSKDFCHALLGLTAQKHTVPAQGGELEAEPTSVLHRVRREQGLDLEPKVSKAEQSNSSVIYDGSVILKFFRRLDAGVNPELEMERFLSFRNFSYSPPLAGALEYHDADGHTSTVAVLTSFISGCHDAWEDTLRALTGFYEKVQRLPVKDRQAPPASESSGPVLHQEPPPQRPAELIGSYLQDAATLGRRTASLHLTLASDNEDPAFKPEPWTIEAQLALSQSMRELTGHNFGILRRRLPTFPPEVQALGEEVLPLEQTIIQRFSRIAEHPTDAVRIRNHGDYHLGQVLHHGADFLIIDFEGEPAISLDERRAKQSALRDVGGMIYSFFYAANAALRELPAKRFPRSGAANRAAWARYWSVWVGSTFLRAYLDTAKAAPFVPADPAALKVMLDVELLRKAIYELGYELNNRPDWVNISFQVLLDLLNSENPI